MSDLETWRKLANELERQPGGRPLTVQALRSACDRIERLERVVKAAEVAKRYWDSSGMTGHKADESGFLEPDYAAINHVCDALVALEQEKADV